MAKLEETWRLRERFRLRQEVFGGLAFDNRTFHVFQVSNAAFDLLTRVGEGPSSTEHLAAALQLSRSSVEAFLQQLERAGVVARATEEHRAPSARERPLRIGEAAAKGTLPTATHVSRLRAPLFVWWDITQACNLRCEYCYSRAGTPAHDELTTCEVRNIIDELADAGVFYIFFLGGEPFLREDFIEILEYARSAGIATMVTTNGWFITPEVARRTAAAGVTIARVSIDGSTSAIHDGIRGRDGSWRRAIEAVREFQQAGIPRVGFSPTVGPKNLHDVAALLTLATEMRVAEIQLTPLCATGRGTQLPELSGEQAVHLRQLVSEFKTKSMQYGGPELNAPEGIDLHKPARCLIEKHGRMPSVLGCGAGRTCAALSATGEVLACILNREPAGSLRETRFERIWSDSPEFSRMRARRVECAACIHADRCSGLCPLQRDKTKSWVPVPSRELRCGNM